jgi:replicative DNA helicase
MIARLSGISLTAIHRRQLTDAHAERLTLALDTLAPLVERLCFVRAPFDLANVGNAADAFGADLIVLDYIQRIPPPKKHSSRRESVDAVMDFLRKFANAGYAVLAVAAVGRTRDSRGRSSYDANGLGLASFKESGELEFGADSAYMLCSEKGSKDLLTLRCLKNRYGEPIDLTLNFDRPNQKFDIIENTKGVAA